MDPENNRTIELEKLHHSYAFHRNPTFREIEYDKIIDVKVDINKIKSFIQSQHQIEDSQDCYIVYYHTNSIRWR